MEFLYKKEYWKYSQGLAFLSFFFLFITQGFDSIYEKASDKLIEAEFKNERIEDHRIYERKGFETDEITINGKKYLLNQDTVPDILTANILEYSVSKASDSNQIILTSDGKDIRYTLWTYSKTKYWRNRLIFSFMGPFVFLLVGFLNLKLADK